MTILDFIAAHRLWSIVALFLICLTVSNCCESICIAASNRRKP